MRILAISNLYPYVSNKVFGIFTARQFEMAAKLGANITVLFTHIWIPQILQRLIPKFKDYNKNHAPLEYEGINVITVPWVRWTRGMNGYQWDGLCIYHAAKNKVLALHREKPFDVLYGKGIFPSADVAVRFARRLNIPAIGEGIGSDVNIAPDYSPAMYRHFLWVAKALDGAVADGQGVAERLSKVMGIEIPTIHGLVDLETFSPVEDKAELRRQLNIPLKSHVLLFAGFLKKEKGVFELLEAFAGVRRSLPNIVLKICGQGGERFNLEKRIAELNISDCAFLVGTVSPADMHKWMQASDLFVLPSYHEGMPNVVMEAMACGLPVISTAVGGLPEAVGDCKGAILIEPRSSDQLASAIIKVGTDKTLREQMGAAARQTAEQKFGAATNSQKMLDYLGSVVEIYKKHS